MKYSVPVSRENVEWVRQVYGAWNERDFEGVLARVDQRHEFRLTGLFPGLKPVYKGQDGMREFLETFASIWPDFRVDVERVEDAGERVVGLVRLCGSGLGSGAPMSIEYAHVFRFERDRAVRTDAYRSWDEARAAAGVDG